MADVSLLRPILDMCYPFQRARVLSCERFTLTTWSRQTGKSWTMSMRRILRGIMRGRNQFFLSAGQRQSRELMMKAKQHLEAIKIAVQWDERELELADFKYSLLEITLPPELGGIRILGLPANPDTARGFTGDVLLDEFAMHKNDKEIWAAMYPSLTRGRGELDVCSTPKGKANKFYELQSNKSYDRDVMTIYDSVKKGNPLTEDDIEELRLGCGDVDIWRQEFGCEFLDEAYNFLSYEMIAACEDGLLSRELNVQALREHDGDVFVGVDIARKKDLTVIWAFQKVGEVFISLGLTELRSTRFQKQFEIISSIIQNPCVRRAAIDETGLGMQLAEQLEERFGSYRVEPCTFTTAFKADAAGKMRVRFEDKNIRIPTCPDIRNDLHSVQKNVTSSGQVRLTADRQKGSHADRFWAAALAVHAGDSDVGPIEAHFGSPLAMSKGRAW